MEKDARAFRNGKKSLQIKGQTSLEKYNRQRVSQKLKNGKSEQIYPIDKFFGKRERGKSCITKGLEKKAIMQITEQSYRQTAKNLNGKIGKESLRRKVIEKGAMAEKIEKTKKEEKEISEQKTKDGTKEGNYKKSRGSRVRAVLGSVFGWARFYLMIDGVGVQGQGKDWEGSKECKVGTMLSQKGEKIKEIGSFCTWERLPGFKRILLITMLSAIGIVGLFTEIVIISDGAVWIRNLRNAIPFLKSAVWILDWFHIKDHLEKMLRALEIDLNGNIAKHLLNLLWKGKVDELIAAIKMLPTSQTEEKKEKQESAKTSLIRYIENQREGIVNYEEYQMKGYFIGSGYVEKTNDTLVKNRMVRQKRMRWGKVGGEAMMQLLTVMTNGRLDEIFV